MGQQKKLQVSQETPLKGPTKVSGLTQIHPLWDSEQQLEGHKWQMRKRGENEVTDNRVRAGRQLPPRQSPETRQKHCPLTEPQSNEMGCPILAIT